MQQLYVYVTAREMWGINCDALVVLSQYIGEMPCMYCGKFNNSLDLGLDCPGGKAKIVSCLACIIKAERDANTIDLLCLK
jgi:hypothetical protein